jgi:polyphenol oxidase
VYGKNTLNLGFTKEDSKATVERNRKAFVNQLLPAGKAKLKSQAVPLITPRQIHSDIIHAIGSPPESPLPGDGLITSIPNLLLSIQTADCLPIILVDTKNHAVGVFHAGWRGTLKRIVEKGVGEMRRHFGTRARDLKAAIGPGIHGCCYEVGEEVRGKFESQFAYAAKLFREVEEFNEVREKYPMLFLTARAPGHSVLPKKIFLDLVEANRQQLLSVGVPAKNIEASDLCTNCRTDLLFSYRAEKGKTGRMMAVAGIKA